MSERERLECMFCYREVKPNRQAGDGAWLVDCAACGHTSLLIRRAGISDAVFVGGIIFNRKSDELPR